MDKNSIETGLSDEQLSAVSDLATTNVYAKQSKWKTFRELPNNEKFPFFVQHFLIATVAIVAAVAVVISLVIFYATRPPATKLYVASFGLADYSQQMQGLQQDFAAEYPQEDPRVFTIDTTFILSMPSSSSNETSNQPSSGASASAESSTKSEFMGGAYLDDSAKLAAMMAAGEINVMIATQPIMSELVGRNNVNDATAVLDSAQLAKLGDAVVYRDDLVSGADHTPVGLNLSKSSVWKAKGLPEDAVLGFGNVTKGAEWPINFVNYLFE